MKKIRNDLYFRLLDEAEEKMQSGVQSGCYVEGLLNNSKELAMSRTEIGFVQPEITCWYHVLINLAFSFLATSIMDAGAETSASFIQNLVLCFLTYPECLKKAQEEIDTVVGIHRLPTWDDYEDLPYLKALIDEVRYSAVRVIFHLLIPLIISSIVSEHCCHWEYLIWLLKIFQ